MTPRLPSDVCDRARRVALPTPGPTASATSRLYTAGECTALLDILMPPLIGAAGQWHRGCQWRSRMRWRVPGCGYRGDS